MRKPSESAAVEIEFIAVDHEGDPAEHAGDEGGEVAKFHGTLMGFKAVVAFGNALDGFAGGCCFAVQLGEKEILESMRNLLWTSWYDGGISG